MEQENGRKRGTNWRAWVMGGILASLIHVLVPGIAHSASVLSFDNPQNLPLPSEEVLYPKEWLTYGENVFRNPVLPSSASDPVWFKNGVKWDFRGLGALPLDAKPFMGKTSVTAYTVGMPVGVSVVRGIVLVGDDNGYTYALNAKTGNLIWAHYGWNMTMSNPLVWKNSVFVSTGNPYFNYRNVVRFVQGKQAIRGPGLNTLYALDLKTGKTLWKAHTKGEMMPTGAIIPPNIWEATGDGHIDGYSIDTGLRIAHVNIRSFDSMSGLLFAYDRLYLGVSDPSRFLSFSPQTKSIRWSRVFPKVYTTGMGDCTPAFSGYTVVSETTIHSGDAKNPLKNLVFALNAKTGKTIWEIPFESGPIPPSMKTATPLIHRGVVYQSSPVSREIAAIRLKTGQRIWTLRLSSLARTSGIIVGSHLIVPTSGGTIEIIDTLTGHLEKENRMGGSFGPATPVVVGGTLYESSLYGHVLAIPLSTLLP
ncbi:MAG: outer membrane protein assembly factor BamB family protein [Leptospirales bacterium]